MSTVRFACFNTALSAGHAGALIRQLSTPEHTRAQRIAEIIQIVRPDVLLLCEFDFDLQGRALALLQNNYLACSQNGQQPLHYRYKLAVPSNTGISSDIDLNGDGLITLPDDGFGFGLFPGQYAFAVLSRYPLLDKQLRTFQTLLWSSMPGARLPLDYYPPEARSRLRLSSKNHIDLPVLLPDGIIHLIAAHPTPPVFDGAEARNSRRNFDEIRLLADYISATEWTYLVDDQGLPGSLKNTAKFIIMGDLNADPYDGASQPGAIWQLLDHQAVHTDVATGYQTPTSLGGRDFALRHNRQRKGDAAAITASFNDGLRVDYVLPAATLEVLDSGIFWPASHDPLQRLVAGPDESSDHRLVWVDVVL